MDLERAYKSRQICNMELAETVRNRRAITKSVEKLLCRQQSVHQSRERGEQMDSIENGMETGLRCDILVFTLVHGWRGQGGERECTGSRFGLCRRKRTKLAVELIDVCSLNDTVNCDS